MNAPHTPGPWVAEINDPMIWIRQADPDAPVICDLVPRDADVFTDEDEANANLIAAAPDLLAACKALIEAPHQEHFAARLNDEEMAGLRAMKVAIAKAEGQL